MNKEIIEQLTSKFLNGLATDAEKQQLFDWYSKTNEQEVVWQTDDVEEEEKVKNKMLAHLKAHIQPEPVIPFPSKINKQTTIYRYLGAVAALLLIGFGIQFFINSSSNTSVQDLVVKTPIELKENKYITLADGSKVILRYGSTLEYPDRFDGDSREVTLVGEAYFDIAKKEDQPFIIHTGKVKTVVLGTAFNIQAYPEQKEIVVSVTRGKVRVEDEQKTLAILTPDEQVVYSESDQDVQQQTIRAEEAVGWTKEDMSFEAIPFNVLAEKLSRRYNVEIKFKNRSVENCPISGRFTGMESLEEVLNILCQTRSTTYTIQDGVVVIDGKGCE